MCVPTEIRLAEDSSFKYNLPHTICMGVDMQELKSSEVRANLPKLLASVFRTREPIGILNNAALVAVLTAVKPKRAIPPLPIRTEQAKADWSNLIDAVAVRGARFSFPSKDGTKLVYLVRHKDFQNEFARQWLDHMSAWQAEHDKAATLDEIMAVQTSTAAHLNELGANLQTHLQEIDQKVRCFFALVNRNGDLSNVPELGVGSLRTADLLERYEAE